jgi:hypothetical protein
LPPATATPTLPPSPQTSFAAVRDELRGDIVFGNLEGTLTDVDTGKCAHRAKDCHAFRVPPDFARDQRLAGFTVMNDANNHSYDFGPDGQADTVRALHAAGIAQDGLPGEVTVVLADAGMPEPDPADEGARLVSELSRDDFEQRAAAIPPACGIAAPSRPKPVPL